MNRRMASKRAPIAMLLLPLLLASPAGAQGKKEKKSKGQPATVYQFSAIEIQGQVQRPSAIYFLQRAKIEYYGEVGVRRSFIPEIIESVIDEALLTTKNRIPRSLIRSYEE